MKEASNNMKAIHDKFEKYQSEILLRSPTSYYALLEYCYHIKVWQCNFGLCMFHKRHSVQSVSHVLETGPEVIKLFSC